MKRRTTPTNSLNTLLLINMKTKRIRTTANSVKFRVYLPDDCWELIFKHLLMDDEDYYSLSLVSKQFLSITNRIRTSLTIKSNYDQTNEEVLDLIGRFPNLTSLNFIGGDDLDYILPELSTFPFTLKSLKFSDMSTFPATGLVTFSTTNSTLNSLTCSRIDFLHSTHMFLIGDCFPKLQHLELSHCNHIYPDLLLKKCRHNITHSNLTRSSIVPLRKMMKFQLPKLEVLNLSYSKLDDQTLNVLTKTCTQILQLSLEHCHRVRDKGVKCALRNCKQLREINWNSCYRVLHLGAVEMPLLRPSLTKMYLNWFE